MDLLEHIQRKATEIIQGMEHLAYKGRLRKLEVQPGKDKALGRSGSSLSVCKGNRCFTRFRCDRTRGSCFKIKERIFKLNLRNKLFTVRVVRQ